MAYKALTPDQRFLPAGRVLSWGRPNTFKTTSIVEHWPEPDSPGSKQFISLPGEKGYESIPHRPSLVSHVWHVEDIAKVSPHAVLREVGQIAAEVLGGTFGTVTTLAVEGIHKLYDYAYDAALDDLLSEDAQRPKPVGADGLRGPAYGIAHKTVMRLLNKLSASGVPYLVVTCWEGDKKDDPKDRSKNAPTHKAPALPGQLADAITGEFGVSVRSTIKRVPQGIQGLWQILPDPEVQGCAVKVGLDIARGLPRTIPQDFRVLRDLISGEPLVTVRERYGYGKPASPQPTEGKSNGS